MKTLDKLREVLDKQKEVVVCRELTKKFEEVIRGSIREVVSQLKKSQIKGEFVVIKEGEY